MTNGVLNGCAAEIGPSFDVPSSQVGFVGSEVRIELMAEGAADLRFVFRSNIPGLCRDGRCRAGIDVTPEGAVFRWVPTSDDLGTWRIDFLARDSTGSRVRTVEVEVRSSIGYQGLPRFVQPLGTGTTLDLAEEGCFDFDIVIDDPDSRSVELSLAAPRIEGAELEIHDEFTATFRWCPEPAQMRHGDHRRLRISADDGRVAVDKEYLLVLRRPPKADCGGESPRIFHEVAAFDGPGPLHVQAQVDSEAELKHAPLLYYSTTDPGSRPRLSQMTQVSMALRQGDRRSGTWEARLDNPAVDLPPGSSASVYYVIVATNSDERSGPCDMHAEAPSRGVYEAIARIGPDPSGEVELCRACRHDNQCGGPDDHCITMGTDSRAFCGRSCSSSSDCGDGYRCAEASLSSVDGRSGRQCVPRSDSCGPIAEPPGCAGDAFEPNDTLASASSALAETSRSVEAAVCGTAPAGDDWYRVEVDADGQLLVELAGTSASDLDLALVDEDGTVRIVSESQRSQEAIASCLARGTYYLRVYGYGGEPNPYTLDVTTRAGSCDGACRADRGEPDDGANRAHRVDLSREFRVTDRTICGGSDDWYRLDLRAGQLVAVDLQFIMEGAEDDLDIHFYNEELEDLTPCSEADPSTCTAFQGQSLDSNEYYDHLIAETGTYYLVVHGFDGAENDYDLRIWLEEP